MSTAPASLLPETRRRKTVAWVVSLATLTMIFDGYDLVIYGTVVPILLRDPHQIGELTPATAGLLGSWALIGVLVGALTAGSVGDLIGRRKVMLFALAWFSIGMALTALMTNAAAFGLLRFITGVGVGAITGTVGALVSEFAPPGKKNLCNAVVYSGFPIGSLLAALLAILLTDAIGWRGMFAIGALPLVTLLPLAILKMPESPTWLLSRGRVQQAQEASARTGVPLPAQEPAPAAASRSERAGYAGLFGRDYWLPTILIGLMSAIGLILVYTLNTWLPELMLRAGFEAKGSLSFLLLLNGGAALGALGGSRFADRLGPKPVVITCFLIGAASFVVLTVSLPLALLLLVVAVAGLGTTGTQILIYGLVANYYRTNVRGAGVAWCAEFGRLGGIAGPLIGGILIGAGLSTNAIFYVLVGLGVFGAILTLALPRADRRRYAPDGPVDAPTTGTHAVN